MYQKRITILSLTITIIVLLIISGVTIGIIMQGITEDVNNNKVEQTNCEHDWVITSKYDWIRESYKTISECSKCGKEVE